MSDVICIDGKFPADQLEYYRVNKVVIPTQDTLYTVRDVIINSNGKTGILLEEIKNPKVYMIHPIMGYAWMEPNWSSSRFRMLNGDELDVLELSRSISVKANLMKNGASFDELVKFSENIIPYMKLARF